MSDRELRPAGFLMDSRGTRLVDTLGFVTYETSFTDFHDSLMRANAERRECRDCGVGVRKDAMYCLECKPYGFWHWVAHYSWWRFVRNEFDKLMAKKNKLMEQ